MTIQRVKITHWRSIGGDPGVELDLGRITVLSGENDSGKTAILLALYGTMKSFRNSHDEFLVENIYLAGSKHQKSNGDIVDESQFSVITTLPTEVKSHVINQLSQTVVSKIHHPELVEKLSYLFNNLMMYKYENTNLKKSNDPFGTEGKLSFDESIERTFLKLLDKYYHDINEVGSLSKLCNWISATVRSGGEFQYRSFFISPNRSYSPHLKEMKSTKEDAFYLGYNVSELVGFIQKIRTEEMMRKGLYKRLLHYVKVLFPDVISISTNIPAGMDHHDVFIEWNKNGIVKNQPLTRSGSGVVSAVYLAGRLLSGSNHQTIGFIDEPETGMHPKLQVRFLKLLRELSEDFEIQWIVSTHSPFIMKNLKDKDRLYLVQHDGSETTARAIEPHDKSTVFQAIGAYLPDTISSRGFVFVEGTTESTLLPLLLKKCEMDIEQEGLVIIPMGGENIYSISPSDLTKIHPKAMVILDSDLVKPLSSGGNLTKKKIDYQQECYKYGVECYISTDYRTIENMYPVRALFNVLNISEEGVGDDPFMDLSPWITNKINLAIKMAEVITPEEASDFPFVKAIMQWWERDH
ncbi:AAA family ATPase [Paenibacillus sp. 11B]|uniref:ATP-dependent nuclease n=1 Tax=unclassified Paenibacillus TaxID=185978 RepID=UPI00264F7ABD|nr:AAA family ATPase [Paenibacillus sp. 11B]MDN8593341.1 AAA family ATPase [Paenibacillus sp. 11B]